MKKFLLLFLLLFGLEAYAYQAWSPAKVITRFENLNLQEEELKISHTIAHHVGKSGAQLVDHLRSNSRLSIASTFRTEIAAKQFIEQAIKYNSIRISDWLNHLTAFDKKSFHYTAKEPVGFGVLRQNFQKITLHKVTIVLKRDADNKVYLLDAYPAK